MAARRPPVEARAFVDGYLTYLLARASHQISGEFHEELARRDVPVMHWRVIAALWPRRALGLTELAGIVLIKQPTCSKLVSRMEALGLLGRVIDRDDRRGVRVSLTPHGRTVGAPLIRAAKATEARVRSPLTKDEETALLQLLRRLIADPSPTRAKGR